MSADAKIERWPAPGKLNLFLHVLGRRADGYHRLQSVFQFIDLGERLDFEVEGRDRIERAGDVRGVRAEQDLAVRAARLLRARAGVRAGVRISVEKRLPFGAGLGGGSSDAATTLVALNALWGLGLGTDELAGLGLELGADVPVFVRGRAAWAEGVGEALLPVELPEPWYALVVPPVSVRTAEIFAAPELTRDTAPITIRDFLAGLGRNDCEAVVTRRYPAVGRALAWLARRGAARLTGTGGGVFAAFDSESAACEALAGLPGAWRGWVARGMNRSPLLERAAAGARGGRRAIGA